MTVIPHTDYHLTTLTAWLDIRAAELREHYERVERTNQLRPDTHHEARQRAWEARHTYSQALYATLLDLGFPPSLLDRMETERLDPITDAAMAN